MSALPAGPAPALDPAPSPPPGAAEALEALARDGRRYGFFQAVHLLHDLHPDRPRVGHQGPPDREPVRLTGWLSLAFPTGDVASVAPSPSAPPAEDGAPAPDGPPWRLESPLLALYGTSSPLPECYTEALLDQDDDGGAERGFLDLFQHRLLSLLWRAWGRYRWQVGWRPGGADAITDRVARLVGLGEGALPPGHRAPRLELLSVAGLLAVEPRTASALELLLRRALPDHEVEVVPFAPRWAPLAPPDLSRLGGERCALGQTAVLGERILDRAGTFRVAVVCPDAAAYLALFDDDGPLVTIRELVDLFNPDLLDCELEQRLAPAARCELRLGAAEARLGWSTWLGRPAPEARVVRRIFQGAFHG
ncbi:MAG: type VI secretion system baseplate subunit TssG [Planctomycetes bacterium]|nr:type VI secretion system baseplate subunit TssG [Planctomycetota bacterium]